MPEAREKAGALSIASAGAVVFAVAASACCWLPLLLVGLGVSGGALSASFEAWRPILLPVTFGFLGMAFYLSYRKPKARAPAEEGIEADWCADGTQDEGACCTASGSGRLNLRKLNRAALWAVTSLVLAFAFFPNCVGTLLGGGASLATRSDLDKLVVRIDGMTCEACAVTIASALRKAPGVAAADVSYERGGAVVGIPKGEEADRAGILAAIAGAGAYSGRFLDQTDEAN